MIFNLSAYHPYTNKAGKTTAGCLPYLSTLEAEILAIKSGTHREVVERLRTITDKTEKHLYKATHLPCFTTSAICHTWRNTKNIQSHTGLICIDIDADNNPSITDWPALRDTLFEEPSAVAAFISASGKGLAIIFYITPGHHLNCFYTLQEALLLKGILVDEVCKDLVRLRFSSYDPDARYRANPELLLPIPELYERHTKAQTHYKVTGSINSFANYKAACEQADTKHPYGDGSKHWHLLQVASYCNHIGMDMGTCIEFTRKVYGPKSPNLTDSALIEPIQSAYRTYKSQHATFKAGKPPYTFTILRKLLTIFEKDLLRQYLPYYGQDSYLAPSENVYTVPNKAIAFVMHVMDPETNWTTREGYTPFTAQDLKDNLPDNAVMALINGQRTWLDRTVKIPLSWL